MALAAYPVAYLITAKHALLVAIALSVATAVVLQGRANGVAQEKTGD